MRDPKPCRALSSSHLSIPNHCTPTTSQDTDAGVHESDNIPLRRNISAVCPTHSRLQTTLRTLRGHGIRHVQQIRGAHASGRLPSRVYARPKWPRSPPRRYLSVFPEHCLSEFGRICECFPTSRSPTQTNNHLRLRIFSDLAYVMLYTSSTIPLSPKRNTPPNPISQFFQVSLTQTLQVSCK